MQSRLLLFLVCTSSHGGKHTLPNSVTDVIFSNNNNNLTCFAVWDEKPAKFHVGNVISSFPQAFLHNKHHTSVTSLHFDTAEMAQVGNVLDAFLSAGLLLLFVSFLSLAARANPIVCVLLSHVRMVCGWWLCFMNVSVCRF